MCNFINPGPIPIGYRYEAQSQSDRTHNIPVEGFELAVKDYREILSQLQTFVSSGSEGAILLLFCKGKLKGMKVKLGNLAGSGVEIASHAGYCLINLVNVRSIKTELYNSIQSIWGTGQEL